VTDPPYGLEFMGKEWDAFRSDDPGTNRHRGERVGAKGALVVGDGTHAARYNTGVSYGGGERAKTNRCVGCGKRDQFRNPHSCPEGTQWKSELIDPYAAPPSSLAFQNWCRTWALEVLRVTKPGGYLLAFGGTRTHHRLVCALEDAGWIIRDELDWIYASGFPKGKANLKPAHEPIVLARKPGPLRPLGIDESRIGTTVETWPISRTYHSSRGPKPRGASHSEDHGELQGTGEAPPGRWPSNVLLSDPELFDEPNPYVVGSGATSVSGARSGEYEGSEAWSGPFGPVSQDIEGSAGGYSRFFIIPKADRAERERGLNHGATAAADNRDRPGIAYQGQSPAPPSTEVRAESAFSIVCAKCNRQKVNVPGAACKCPDPEWVRKSRTARLNLHPTVKPIDLMRHLVRLVTPPGGVVLDPFLGSGTTCLAASEEGFRSIGIEREVEYLEIAKGRLMATPMGFSWGEVPA
jgi:site-specific DNA-methyltransferase (adenine-specific)